LRAGTVTILVKLIYERDWPVFKDLRVWDRMPNLVGMTLSEVQRIMDEKDLSFHPRGAGNAADPNAGQRRIQGQIPEPNVPVSTHSAISVILAAKPVIPSLIGQTEQAAIALLTELGLSPDIQWGDAATSREQFGTVQSQTPAPGTDLRPGLPVRVFLYAAVVPDLAGLNRQNADAAIAAAWLTPVLLWGEEVANSDLWDTVQTQSPAPGTKVALDTTVQVTVFKKPTTTNSTPYQALIGHWEGFLDPGEKPKHLNWPLSLAISTVNLQGQFKGEIVWNNRYGATVQGTVQETTLEFTMVKNTKSTFLVGTGKHNRFTATWNPDAKTIMGTAFTRTDKYQNLGWQEAPISLRKQMAPPTD
jgi:hypothetical protein